MNDRADKDNPVSTPEVDECVSNLAGLLSAFGPVVGIEYDEVTYKALVELAEEMRVTHGWAEHKHPNIQAWLDELAQQENAA
jgi:hypothetical protein